MTQFNEGRPQLGSHGMLGTFYVNSGKSGLDDGLFYMRWAELDSGRLRLPVCRSGTVKAGKRFKLGKVSAAAIPGKLVTLRLELSKNGLSSGRSGATSSCAP